MPRTRSTSWGCVSKWGRTHSGRRAVAGRSSRDGILPAAYGAKTRERCCPRRSGGRLGRLLGTIEEKFRMRRFIKSLLLTASWVLLGASAFGACAFDATVNNGGELTSGSSMTFNATVTGSNPFLIVHYW